MDRTRKKSDSNDSRENSNKPGTSKSNDDSNTSSACANDLGLDIFTPNTSFGKLFTIFRKIIFGIFFLSLGLFSKVWEFSLSSGIIFDFNYVVLF